MLQYHHLAHFANERHQQALADAEQRRLLALTLSPLHKGDFLCAIRKPFGFIGNLQVSLRQLLYLGRHQAQRWPTIDSALSR